jgi:serine/threonine protein kinase
MGSGIWGPLPSGRWPLGRVDLKPMAERAPPLEPVERAVGRYIMCDEIAAGGMATVHIGRLLGPVGFARTVAIKRLHAHFAKDPEFVTMLLDEARLTARIRHPNVVSTLDVVMENGELLVVMDYVQGESLSHLARASGAKKEPIPLGIAMSVMAGALYGLHAAHEATTEQGAPLCVIHRDISPQNIMVGVDGVARVLDFGVARAVGRIQTTREGTLKGKLAYMSPEQVRGETLDRRSDLYAIAVVVWELVTGQRLFVAETEAEMLNKVLRVDVKPPSSIVPTLLPALDALLMKGLSPDRSDRFETALQMAEAAQKIAFATSGEVGAWVTTMGGNAIADRRERLARIESQSSGTSAIVSVKAPARPADPFLPPPRTMAASSTVVGKGSGPPLALPAPTVAELEPMASSSQLSSVSVSRSIPRTVPLGLGLAVLGGALFVGALVIALLTLKLRATDGGAGPAQDPPTASGLATTTPVAASQAPSAPVAPVTEVPSPATAPSATSAAVTARVPPPPLRRAPPSRSTKCKPPYTIDANGIRSPKPECM